LWRCVTFFTRPECGLCAKARGSLSQAWDQSPENNKFNYKEVDITKPENKQWYDLYAYDVPVVHIVDDRGNQATLMHQMTTSEVLAALTDASKQGK
jgi:glutaredoxin